MKVVITGNNSVWAIENHFVAHLRRLGVHVVLFNCTSHYNPSAILNRVLNRLEIHIFYKRVNDALLEFCREEKPDIVWVFKGVELYLDTLTQIREMGIRLYNYNPDHPFIRTAISHGSDRMAKAIPYYDGHFCYSADLVKVIGNKFKVPGFRLPFAYEPSPVHRQSSDESPDDLKVCMVGNADRKRAEVVRILAQAGFHVDVYGNFWQRFLKPHQRVRLFPAIYGDVFWRMLLNYRIQLNVFRPHNEGAHNMRTFEIPSVGGIQLAPYSKEHEEFFHDGSEIWLYRDDDHLLSLAENLMARPGKEIKMLRKEIKTFCGERPYTYADRALTVKEVFDKAGSAN